MVGTRRSGIASTRIRGQTTNFRPTNQEITRCTSQSDDCRNGDRAAGIGVSRGSGFGRDSGVGHQGSIRTNRDTEKTALRADWVPAAEVVEMAFAAPIGRISKDQSAIAGIPMTQIRERIGSRRSPGMSFSVRLPFIPSKDISDTRRSLDLAGGARPDGRSCSGPAATLLESLPDGR